MRKLLIGLALAAGIGWAQTQVTTQAGFNTCAGTAGAVCNVHSNASGGQASYTAPTVASGSVGAVTTLQANSGETVTITTGFSVAGKSYIRITGFQGTISGTWISADASTNHVLIDNNHVVSSSGGSLWRNSDPGGASDNAIVNNYYQITSAPANNVGIYLAGSRNLMDHNELINTAGDCHDIFGDHLVIRNTYCHELNESSGQHIDFIQEQPSPPNDQFILTEGNIEKNCHGGLNCHFMEMRGDSSLQYTNNIVRFNYVNITDSGGVDNGSGSGDVVLKTQVYNNTLTQIASQVLSCNGSTAGGISVNNVSYQSAGGGQAYSCSTTGDGFLYLGNNFTDGTTSFCADGSHTCRTGSPGFANYPTDGTLTSGSQLRGTGSSLATTNGTGSNSQTLIVNNGAPFQPGSLGGWGPNWPTSPGGLATVLGDCIRVGDTVGSPTTCVTAVSGNTITVSPAISWSNGVGVYLYKKSDGVVVLDLANAKPDIGAFPYGMSAPSASVSPTSLGPWTNGQVITSGSAGGTLTASNFAGTVTWSKLSGTQPTGLAGTCFTGTTGTSCTQTGTLTAAGTFTFTIRATDGTSTVDTTFSNVVVNATPAITTSSLPGGTVGTPYSQVLATSGGTGAVSCSLASGSLPNGLSLTGTGNCTISGTPTVANLFGFSITPTDSNSVAGIAAALPILISGAGAGQGGSLTGAALAGGARMQ